MKITGKNLGTLILNSFAQHDYTALEIAELAEGLMFATGMTAVRMVFGLTKVEYDAAVKLGKERYQDGVDAETQALAHRFGITDEVIER